MKLGDLALKLGVKVPGGGGVDLAGVTCDSRAVRKGYLFACVKGESVDGHDFIQDAASRGAAAALVERDVPAVGLPLLKVPDVRAVLSLAAAEIYGRPSEKLVVVGVTGTNGKTTTCALCESIIRAAGGEPGVVGTVNYRFAGRVLPARNTTPEAAGLQELLAQMVTAGCTHAVLEVSSHGLDQGRVKEIEFDVAVFTNLSRDHLDYHGTMDKYLSAKAELFASLGGSARKARQKAAVLNADDPASGRLAEKTSARVITYSVAGEADVAASNVRLRAGGTVFSLHTPVGTAEVALRLLGAFNVSNALAAAGFGIAEGLDLDVIVRGLAEAPPVRGRLERVPGTASGLCPTVLVDYAHTPDALEKVLKTCREFADGRLICVFGCGGDRDRGKRPKMGEIAARLADRVIVTSDNPRSESPLSIIEMILEGIGRAEGVDYAVIPDRETAIFSAVESAGRGDVVLIAGKGHETYQLMGKTVVPFDDVEVARRALGAVEAGREC